MRSFRQIAERAGVGFVIRLTNEVNVFDDHDSSRGDRGEIFWLMDLLLRSALPLSVNLNRYATKVASHIKLPLSRSVLPVSWPLEVTALWRGNWGEEERVRGVRSWRGRWGDQRVILWDFDTGEWLTTGFCTCVPHSCRGVHYYHYITVNARSTWREEFFNLAHLLWSQAPRWGDLHLASQWVHNPIYSHAWSSPLETYFISIHEQISRII